MKFFDEIPDRLYNCDVREIDQVLGGASLITLEGVDNENPILISTLLHGNETTSFEVLQLLLNNFKEKKPEKTILILVGNTLAASEGVRHLEGQNDFNRVWDDSLENEMVISLKRFIKEKNLFANIDIHNNTGKNPFYSCINKIDGKSISLGKLFSEKIVYFTEPHSVQSNYFSEICPSITIEAGLPGNESGRLEVFEFIKNILTLDKLDESELNYPIYKTYGRIRVDMSANITFRSKNTNGLSFIEDIDEYNFTDIKVGREIGKTTDPTLIKVYDNNDIDITNEIFDLTEGLIRVKESFIPAMFTKDVYVMKNDCMGYLMKRVIAKELI